MEAIRKAFEEAREWGVIQPEDNHPDRKTDNKANESITKKSIKEIEQKYLLKSIDPKLLPSPIKEYCEDVAKRLNIPFEATTTTALAFLTNLISDKLALTPSFDATFRIIPNLWGCIVADPGARKTPMLKAFNDIIYKHHFRYVEIFNDEKEKYEAKRNALSNAIKQIAKAEVDGDIEKVEELNATIERLKRDLEKNIKSRYLLLSDITKEKITSIAEYNDRGILIFQDELTKLLQYFQKDPEMRSLLLEGYNGASFYTISRINRGDINIKKLTIGVFGGIQPEVFYNLMIEDKYNEASGFLDRMQLVYIYENPIYKITNTTEDARARDGYCKIVDYLINRELKNYTGAREANIPYLILSPEAQREFIEFLEGINNELSQEYPNMRGFFSKLDKLIGGIAIFIYTIEAYQKKLDGIIPLSVIQRAIQIAKFYVYQAIQIRSIASMIEHKRDIEFEKKRDRVLNYMQRQKLPISLREVCRTLHMRKNELIQIIEPYYVIEKRGRTIMIISQKRCDT